ALQALAAAERDDERAVAATERRRLADEIARVEGRVCEAREVEMALAALRAEAAAQPFDPKALKTLEALEADRRAASAAVAATAPTIRFEPEGGASVTDDAGRTLASGEPPAVASPRRFHLEGFGWIGGDPGPGAAELAGRQRAAEDAMRAGLAKARVASLDEARRLAARAEERRMEAGSLTARLQAILPEGLASAGEALAASRATLEALPAADEGDADVDADAKALRARRRAAQERAEEAARLLEAARRAAAALASRRAGLEADARHRAEEADRLRAELGDAEARRAAAALAEDLSATELDRAAKEAVAQTRRAALGGADPDGAARALAGSKRALEELNRTVRALRDEIIALETELGVRGAAQLGETLSRLRDEIEAAEPRVARLTLEAGAAKLLHATLIAAQREAREHWLGPIKAQVAPYLRIIHPESEIELDETTLEIRSLHRRGVEEEFRRLSSGAREQVAVVTRLALANVLKRGGHPAAVILDDALVNTDEVRLGRMHEVLRQAAEGLQIIVLTCRERDFRHLGGRTFRL
ncbi:hypothetical protein, partial [Aureimonas pseudogalii]|uniref:hypothetical protein n=1 Tax=Aureimonas pseudogalii TaxID=1744844 RepID=UPI0035E5BC39